MQNGQEDFKKHHSNNIKHETQIELITRYATSRMSIN